VSEVRQRWRLVFARDEDARYLSHLDAVHQWERAFRRTDLPVATSEGFSPRPRLVFAAPLQLGMLAEHDLADLYLAERLTAPDLRLRLDAGLPRGYRLVDLFDVWVGEPALAPQLAAADYRLTLFNVEQRALDESIGRVLAASELPRERRRETKTTAYDLRPLILDLRACTPDVGASGVAGDGATDGASDGATDGATDGAAPLAGLWMRLRHSQDRGSGRPDEVVAALAAELGFDSYSTADDDTAGGETPAETAAAPARPVLEVVRPVRERLWLSAELEPAG